MKMPPDNLNQDPTQPGFIDLYAFFKISKNATDSEIDKVFRKMSMAWHPDRNRGNAEAAQMFAKLSSWRDLLKDPQRRAEYDASLIWFNNEKERKRRPPPAPSPPPSPTPTPPPRGYSSSSYSYAESDYGSPPRRQSRAPRGQDYAPRYETRVPRDYDEPMYETRQPSDYERPRGPRSEPRRHRSSRQRDDDICQCPDCTPPSSHRSSRSSRTERVVYEEPPRYESRAQPRHRSSRQQSADSCACSDCVPSSYRSSRRRNPEYIIIEEFIDEDDNGNDRPFFEYESRSPFGQRDSPFGQRGSPFGGDFDSFFRH